MGPDPGAPLCGRPDRWGLPHGQCPTSRVLDTSPGYSGLSFGRYYIYNKKADINNCSQREMQESVERSSKLTLSMLRLLSSKAQECKDF